MPLPPVPPVPLDCLAQSSPQPSSSAGASTTMSPGVAFTTPSCSEARRYVNSGSSTLPAAPFARYLRALRARLGQPDRDRLLAAPDLWMPALARLQRAALRAPHGAANGLLRLLAIPRTPRATTPCHCSLPVVGAAAHAAVTPTWKVRHARPD